MSPFRLEYPNKQAVIKGGVNLSDAAAQTWHKRKQS